MEEKEGASGVEVTTGSVSRVAGDDFVYVVSKDGSARTAIKPFELLYEDERGHLHRYKGEPLSTWHIETGMPVVLIDAEDHGFKSWRCVALRRADSVAAVAKAATRITKKDLLSEDGTWIDVLKEQVVA